VGARHRLIALLFVPAALLGAPACKRGEKAPPPPAPSARPGPDHLAKGEIPEGREHAFTLPLPLHSTIRARFAASVHVASPHTEEEVANFVKARVKEGTVTSGASETRFDKVVVTKDPSRMLSIQVRPAPISGEYRSQLVVEDVTPPPEEPGTTDADRWRKAGLTPDGRPIDPKNMQ
jgi:hypothetical protein